MAVPNDTSTSAPIAPAPYKLSHNLVGHAKAVSCVKFSPHHPELLASSSADHSVIIWNINEGSQLRSFEGHTQGINDVCWSHNGRYLCTAADDKNLKIWDVETGKSLRTLSGHTNYVFCCRFDPHDHLLVSEQPCRTRGAAVAIPPHAGLSFHSRAFTCSLQLQLPLKITYAQAQIFLGRDCCRMPMSV